MTWNDVEAAFARAVELEPSERSAFLQELAASQPDIACEVGSLLTADGYAVGWLDRPLVSTHFRKRLNDELVDDERLPHPESIGPYRVVSRLGAGGMSQVFLAERSDGDFTQRVAVKLIRTGMMSEHLIRRFETERQILAQLAHPNIAPLLDGGRTEEGLPYLVMEHVEGVPIDEYCDAQQLTLDERLHLFLSVCSAVQYAHSNLIVHRDIKVSNILVTEGGNAKLLDFGIAKLLSPELFPLKVEQTATRLRPMTPYYASPEQIESGPITTATDVYSLGVLLYKLLTGEFPHDFEGLSPRAVEERVLNEAPRPLRDVVASSSEALRLAAEQRRVSAKGLVRRLSGELELVLRMALRKEPSRRFATVEQFSSDIRAFLLDLPLVAHKDSILYRVRKFVDRNRAATAIATITLLTILAFSTAMWRQSRVIRFERDQVRVERDRSDQVVELLQEMFRASDPLSEEVADLTATEVLEAATRRIDTELATQPRTRAELIVALAGVMRNLGLYESSQEALERLSASLSEHDLEVQDAASIDFALGLVQLERGDYSGAEVSLLGAISAFGSAAVPTDRERAFAHGALGSLFHRVGRFDEAEANFRLSIPVLRRDKASARLAAQLNDFGMLRSEQGDFAEAHQLLGEALAMRRSIYPARHSLVADSLNDLAVVYGIQGEYERAAPLLAEAYEIRRELLGPAHPLLALNANNLARIKKELGEFELAEELYLEATGIVEAGVGPDHPDYARCLHNLGMLYLDLERLGPARQLFEEAVAIRSRTLGDDHMLVGLSLAAIGRTFLSGGDAGRARPFFDRALEIQTEHLGVRHWRIGETRGYIGECLLANGQVVEAEQVLKQARATLTDTLGASHRRTLRVRRVIEKLAARLDGSLDGSATP